MKLLKTLILLVLIAIIFLPGCIDDDRSGCPVDNNLALTFSYLNFAEHIGRVTVAVYDSEDHLAECLQVEKSSLDIFQGIRLNLPSGSYTAVCWGNAFNNTQIDGLAQGDDLSFQRTANPGYFSSTLITTNDSLYYGMHRFTVNPGTTTNQTITFTPAYIRLIIQIKGLTSTAVDAPTAGYPYIKVNNLAPAYDYTMVTQGDLTTYYPATIVDSSNKLAQTSCNVLRFGKENSITIDVVENQSTNTVLHRLDLQSFIIANNIEITNGKEVVIPILISFEAGVTVTKIDGWGDTPVEPKPQL